MSIKTFFVFLAEKITGRRCTRCRYNCRGRCGRSDSMFMRCWHSITRPGFAKRRHRYLKPEEVKLTREERHQLQKIKGVLQDAGNTARESGMLED
jgi:hypothetical protein